MRRLIADTLEDHLAMELLGNTYHKGEIIHIGTNKDALVYNAQTEVAAGVV